MMKKQSGHHSKWIKLLNAAFVAAFFGVLLIYSFTSINYPWRWEVLWEYRVKFLNGFLMTLVISFFALFLSLAIGITTALMRSSSILFLQYLSRVYVELIRGTPLLVQMLIFFYVVAAAFHLENRYLLGVLILSVFSGAYVTEIIRAGLQSIGSSQLETAKSLGFTKGQTLRYIIMPQLAKIVFPPLAGQFASIVKDSSLLSIIAVNEFTKNVQEVDSINFASLENYLFLGLGYLLITLPISAVVNGLERKMHYET